MRAPLPGAVRTTGREKRLANILVADDVKEGRDLLRTLLGSFGHTVIEAANGLEALERAAEIRPDLVISDIAMPGCDGYELVHRLHSTPPTATVPVIIYSAACVESHTQKLAAACGVSHVLAKPSDPETILALVAATLLRAAPAPAESAGQDFAEVHTRTLVNTLAQKVAE